MDSFFVDLVRSLSDLLRGTVSATKSSLNKLFAVLVEEVERIQVRTSRDLDQLGEAIPDLGGW